MKHDVKFNIGTSHVVCTCGRYFETMTYGVTVPRNAVNLWAEHVRTEYYVEIKAGVKTLRDVAGSIRDHIAQEGVESEFNQSFEKGGAPFVDRWLMETANQIEGSIG